MPVSGDDLSFLVDMARCASDIGEFTEGMSFRDFEKNRTVRLAVERQLGMIGQAACKINRKTRMSLANIPWAVIMGLKGKMAHGFGEVLPERIWAISGNPLRKLLKDLEEIDEVREYIIDKKSGLK